MSSPDSRLSRLQRVIDVTREEREAAKSLDWQALEAATQIKTDLLATLEDETVPLTDAERDAAEMVRLETQRNAYFLSFTLQWVQDSLDLIQGSPEPPAYGYGGDVIESRSSGSLVNGKV
ncbi:flagellar protein FlgN [Desulfohalobium retbaense]|uniref:FlgN family protein n=1 Tax=Desulfohalobium retbaense (strain ATCC 49708 / DSM 5692 / JCM 16813 / HR100) TaxID=485915 RepID=C8WYY2_DESRD|nr:flagellar protein FlgN [Desulfohalobium retbaense]ACV67898.1 hypothetical protein Dret_0601 [Desulfohalobium retbaense DSM 5692]